MLFVLLEIMLLLLLAPIGIFAQQQCYFGPGAANRGPSELVPCSNDGESACCLLGDTCLSGNACYNNAKGNVYQYGCTDLSYTDPSCPLKCGYDTSMQRVIQRDAARTDHQPALSPWTALEICDDVQGVNNTWVCHAPESCGCQWSYSTDMIKLTPRGCKEMGSDARVALYAPSALAPYVSLPSTRDGSTSYYSGTTVNGVSTWIQTAISGCKCAMLRCWGVKY
jgi:hypothetical protein